MSALCLRHSSLEPNILRIGREIFRRAEAAAPSVFSTEFWQQSAMDRLTAQEDLKRRLFRFIEVMPALQDTASFARHLYEYLAPAEVAGAAAGPLACALGFRSHSFGAALAAGSARLACERAARQFIAGATPAEAVAAVKGLRRRRAAFTLDVLGETIIADRIARQHQRLYIELLNHLSTEARHWVDDPLIDRAPWGPLPKVNISLKLSAIVVSFDPIDPQAATEAVLDRLRPILRTARQCGAFLNIDMEHYAVKDLTLELYKRVLSEPPFKSWPDCGLVIQCYMPEADRDLEELIAWARRRGTPITVRLVKGAYWDSETARAVRNGWPNPLYDEKWQSDAAFERLGRLMLENADIVRPAFASHNVRSIAAVLAMEGALGLPPRTLELQMLTGMGNPLKRAMVAMNQRVRVYTPFGDLMTGMAYLIRRLIENTANESFLRQSFGRHLPIEHLLRAPTRTGIDARPALPKPVIQDPDESTDMPPFENESDIDFSKPENRQAMHDALAEVRGRFGRKYPAIVGGAGLDTRVWHDALNPSNPSEIVGRSAVCEPAIADQAVTAARSAFRDWARTPASERAAILRRAADLLRERRFELAAWMIYETGKTWREAQGDYMETADYLRFYAREIERLDRRRRRRDYPGEANEYVYAPRGVVVVLAPFCFPTALLTGMAAAALVTGNTVVVKPASTAAVCAARVCEILNRAGLPPGVLNFVPGRGEEVGEFLARHADVDMIAFTGSREVGCRLIEHARRPRPGAHAFKHIVAEMGGANAIIVDDDADIDEAVQGTLASAFGYSGQKCTACSRVIVLESVYAAYLEKLVEAAEAFRPGPADRPSTTIGPLIDAAAVERAERFVRMGKEEARCVFEGRADKNPNGAYFFAPVIFADVPAGACIAQEERLAPVLSVITADSFEKAIEIANGTPYGLVGGVYSRSPARIEAAKQGLRVGTLYINRRITVSRVDRQPFGGFKLSGLGTKTGGPDYLQQFTLPRTVSENTIRHGFSPGAEVRRSRSDEEPIARTAPQR